MPIVKLGSNKKSNPRGYSGKDEDYRQKGEENSEESSFTETERQMFALERFINSCPLPEQN